MRTVLCIIIPCMVLLSIANGSSIQLLNVILISWDGVQREHLYNMLEEGKLPNLQSLIWEVGIADITVTDHTTDTKAGHSEMLTGYPPRITSVWNNKKFKPIPKGYTIFERLEKHSGGKIVTVMLTGKTHNLGGERGEPFYIAKKNIDVFDSNAAPASVVGPKAINYIERYYTKQFFFFFHFSDPDSKGHLYGENSTQYENGIIACDLWLGKIIASIKEKGIYENTIIYVTADHGFDEGKKTHSNAPYVFIASNRKVRSGDQKDIVPTILQDFGISISEMRPGLLGKSLRVVDDYVSISPSEDEIEKIYENMPRQFTCPYFEEKSKKEENELLISDISYKSDGLMINGMLFRPSDEGKKPLLLLNHGGGWGINRNVERWGEKLAGKGYVVLASSYRGEDGSEGRIEVGSGEVVDILNLTECGKKLPYVDSSRIGIIGTSHGGLNTLLACEVYKFDACIDFYGITDFLDLALYDNLSFGVIKTAYEDLFGHEPSKGELRMEYIRRSPLYFARHMKAPLLVIHGTADMLIPINQSLRLVAELEKWGKVYEVKTYEDAPHGFNYLPRYEEETFTLTLTFLKKYIG
jgi:dienelactone hydrolase